MNKLRKSLFGFLVLLTFILSFGIVSAALSGGNGALQIDSSSLTVSTAGSEVEQISGEHGTSVTGTFTLDAVGAAVTVTGITPATLYLNGDATSLNFIPSTAITFTDSSGTVIGATGASLAIASGASEVITYTVVIPNLQYAGTYKLDTTATAGTAIVATDGTNPAGFDFEVTVNESHVVSISEASLSNSTVLGNSATYQMTLENTGNINETVTFNLPDLTLNWKNSENLTTPAIGSVTVSSNSTQTVSFTINSDSTNDRYGEYSGTLTMTAGTITDTASIELETQRDTDDGIARLSNYNDIEDMTGDDSEWRPGDIISIQDLEMENTASSYILEDSELEITLYKVSNGKKYADYGTDKTDIDEDDNLEDDYELQIPYDAPAGNYILQFYMVGENENNSTEKHTDLVYSNIISVERDSRHVVVQSLDFSSTDVSCGDTITATVKVSNIGTRDLDEGDSVRVKFEAGDFSVDETTSIDDLNEDKTKSLTYTIPIPTGKASGVYLVTATVEYDNDDNDDGTTKTVSLDLGNCTTVTESTLTGTSSSSGKAGEEIRYDLTISNTGSGPASFTFEVAGASDWATTRTEPAGTITLDAGATSSVVVYLTPNLESSGSHTATVNVKSGGTTIASKALAADVTSGRVTITTFTSSTLSELGTEAGMLSASVALNVILVAALITLAHLGWFRRPPVKGKKESKK